MKPLTRADTLPVLGPIMVLALVAAAGVLPAGYYRGKFLEEGVDVEGWRAGVFGWGPMLLGHPLCLGWFANLLSGIGLLYLWRRRFARAAGWSTAGVGLSLLPLALYALYWHVDVRLDSNPALVFTLGGNGNAYAWAELRAGYFVWVAAHVLTAGLAAVCWYRGRGAPALDLPGE